VEIQVKSSSGQNNLVVRVVAGSGFGYSFGKNAKINLFKEINLLVALLYLLKQEYSINDHC
jgi:hypothetical protein